MARRIYFDTSALSRPFDDQGQLRIRLEAEAIEHLVRAVRERTLEWISSDIVMFEVRKCPDEERRNMLELLCRGANERVALSEAVSQPPGNCAPRVSEIWTPCIWQRPSKQGRKCFSRRMIAS